MTCGVSDRYWYTADEARAVIAAIWVKLAVAWYGASAFVAVVDWRGFVNAWPLLLVPLLVGAVCWFVAPPKGATGKY